MRKSFTRLFSVLVLLLLSIQMVMATPTLKTPGGLSPSDGGTVASAPNPVFTMNFQAAVAPVPGQIIGLYNSNGLVKSIQLRPVDADTINGAIVFSHNDGTVTFNGSVVTILFKDVTWAQGVSYWITVGSSAIKDPADGKSFVPTLPANFGINGRWDFTTKDTTAPTVKALWPADNAKDVGNTTNFGIKFNEKVKLANCSVAQNVGDFALYSYRDTNSIVLQEGGDLISITVPTIKFYDGATLVGTTATNVYPAAACSSQFDSVAIVWNPIINPFPDNALMYIRVKPGLIVDLSNNAFAGINDNDKWNFNSKDESFKAFVGGFTGADFCPASNFYINLDPAGTETLYLASNNKALSAGQDLSSIVKVADKDGNPIACSVKLISTGKDSIVIDPTNALTSAMSPFTFSIDAGKIKDASGNFNAAFSKKLDSGNWDAPKLVSSRVTNQNGSSFDFLITASEPATVHYVVVRKDAALKPTIDQIFGRTPDTVKVSNGAESIANGISGFPAIRDIKTSGVHSDYYILFDSTTISDPLVPDSLFEYKGSFKKFYGKQTGEKTFNVVEIFAQDSINIPQGNFEVLERITGLPSTHGLQDTPASEYDVYFVLADNSGAKCNIATTYYKSRSELLSGILADTTAYTTNVLMPEVWFDADSSKAGKLINSKKLNPAKYGTANALGTVKKDGKIYINLNEKIYSNTGAALTDAQIAAGLYVYEGTSMPAGADRNSDANWSSNVSFTASYDSINKKIAITRLGAWSSGTHIWVKIKNSKFEDIATNEVVCHDNLYTQEFVAESSIAPIVRYSFGKQPLDSLQNVNYFNYKEGKTSTIDVTVSSKIYVFPGTVVNGTVYQNTTKENLIPFTNNPTDDQFIGKFFKIRKAPAGSKIVNASMGDALELTDFEYKIDYTYGDSTKITITPKKQYDSEVWYYVELDKRIQDVNLRTIAQGALEADSLKPAGFKWSNAYTGNATSSSWSKSFVPTPVGGIYTIGDNSSVVFKTDDSKNPVLTFFSKQLETGSNNVLDALPIDNINGKSNIALNDTIGVYINEYVSLGFDHYVHFDSITSTYQLDANAMRRYFKVFDGDSAEMNFDIVDLDTSKLKNDTLIFFIDPYYVNANGQPKSNTETANFSKNTKYTAYFNSKDADDQGKEEIFGREKGIYWDDNHNLVLEARAQFTTVTDPAVSCVAATITPAPGSKDLIAGNVAGITFNFENAITFGSTVPTVTLIEGTSTVTTLAGVVSGAAGNIVNYNFPVALKGSSVYTVTVDGDNGYFTLNTGNSAANIWPKNACGNTNNSIDSTWTFTTKDATAPQLDSTSVWIANAKYDVVKYGSTFLYPTDDDTLFDTSKDLILVFNEEVYPVTGKALTIYDQYDKSVATIYAQSLKYGVTTDKKEDKHVLIVPNAYFNSYLKYKANYHVNIDNGFVTDLAGNPWAGIWVADNLANGAASTDLANDWSFGTAVDPAPSFAKFSPMDIYGGVTNLSITFSEPVIANPSSGQSIIVYKMSAPGLNEGSSTAFKPTDTDYIIPSENGKVWTINAEKLGLTYGNQYYITITSNSFLGSSNASLVTSCTQGTVAYNTSLSAAQTSTTAAQWWIRFGDNVAPTVLKTWPAKGYEHIPYNAYLYVKFTEPIYSAGSKISNDLIDSLVQINVGSRQLARAEYDVEFIGNDNTLLRITPKDHLGYQYKANSANPTMAPDTIYTVTILNAVPGLTIADANGNSMSAQYQFTFKTEDIVAPTISNQSVAIDTAKCSNKVTFQFNVTEASDTAVVYYAILPKVKDDANKPSASALFDQTVSGAVVKGVTGAKSSKVNTITVDMPEVSGNPEYVLWAVVRDTEKDIWAPASSDWDSLFMFAGSYDYDRIRDIMPSPNKNNTVYGGDSLKFRVWDNDAPTFESYPLSGTQQFPVEDSIRFWFSEAVVPGNVAGLPDSIYLRRYDNNIAVAAKIKWPKVGDYVGVADPDSSFVITPVSELEQETKYYVEFDRYAIKDASGVCPNNSVYYPQMVGRGFWFETEDNIAPRLKDVSPDTLETCVACPDLNNDGTDYISVFFNEQNGLQINPKATSANVSLFRVVDGSALAWDVIPADSITFVKDAKVDTLWEARIPLYHEYYPNDLIEVNIPANLFSDKFGNACSKAITWRYSTCNTDSLTVKTTIYDLKGHFNYSKQDINAGVAGVYGEWNTYKTLNSGSVVTGVPTHVALKVDFGENVFFNTSKTSKPNWEQLSTYGTGSNALTASEIMSVLNVSGLTYSETTPATNSNIDSVVVVGNTVTLLFKSADKATKLPVYELLATAKSEGHITANVGTGVPAFLGNYYKASLKSDLEYTVTVAPNKVLCDTTSNKCTGDSKILRYAASDILTFKTRNDEPATVAYFNNSGDSLSLRTTCIAPQEAIKISFSKPVVKSSYDILWNLTESSTSDNLPLSVVDLQGTNYIQFKKATYNPSKGGYDLNDVVAVNATTSSDFKNFTITPKSKLSSDSVYCLVFNKFTVKNYVENDPNGTVFGGDSCFFKVSDYVAPIVDVNIDNGGFIDGMNPAKAATTGSDTKKVQIVFNESVLLGNSGVTKIRRAGAEQGASVFAEFDVKSPNVTVLNSVKTNGDTVVFNLPNGLEDFTTYYVEMPKGFIVDDDSCNVNQFIGLSAKLGKDGEMLAADYSFKTSDASAPELISVVVDKDTILDVEGSIVGLFPIPGSTVAKDSKLRLTFDENVNIGKTTTQGIVIYHSNGDAGSFGNAVEFIPWSDLTNVGTSTLGRISLSGTDIYNGLTSNVIDVDPLTTFEAKGTYYVRVSGDSVYDYSANSWSLSAHEALNPVKDQEWLFTVANDVAPVLVETSPAYDGVNKPQVYDTIGKGEADYGFVKTDLTMTFFDNTKANGGQPLNVAKGDSLRKVRIFEYTYDAATATYKANPWIVLPITDSSITVENNVVTIHDVILRDGINGKGASVELDSAYYVTVDKGAIVNGFAQSRTAWAGIDNGFRWRFQTADDTVFVDGFDIVSPNIADDDSAAMDLTIKDAKNLIVEFEEAIAAAKNPKGKVQLFNEVGLVHEFTVTPDMCKGKVLTVPAEGYIKDETAYRVFVQAGAFNDGSNAGNPNREFGGVGVWEFITGDNTNPAPVITPDSCIGSDVTFTLTYNESKGITKGSGSIKITKDSTLAAEFDVNDIEFTADSTGAKTVGTISLKGLKDTTSYTLTIPAGFVFDGDETPLASKEIVWNFKTADNTLPTATVVTPLLAVTTDTIVTIKFSEIVTPVAGKFVTIGGTKYATSAFATVDNLTYTVAVSKLPTEVDCPVTFEAGSFIDVNAGCTPNGIADGFTTTFKVADISAPVALGTPTKATDYVGLEIALNFDDAVAKNTGNVKIYDAENDSLIETIPVSKFTAATDSVYTYKTENVKFGEYYVLMDAGSFVDNGAIEGFRLSKAIEKGDWSLVVSDVEFDCAGEIVYPTRGSKNVPLDTTIVITFCGERIKVGTKADRFVTISDQSIDKDYIYYSVVDSMIDGDKLSIAVSGLKENTTYSIIIAPGAITDEAGNEFVGIIDANTWLFTTGDFSSPIVTVTPDTVYNNAAGKVTITSTEAGFVYFAQKDVAATQQALLAAVQNDLAVAATVAANGSVELSTNGLKVGEYKAYAIDATGSIGVAKNVVVVIDDILPLTTISAIQGSAAASPLVGKTVRTKGTVTAIDKNGFYMQDANAAWSGVYVFSTQHAGDVSIGNSVEVIATVDEFNGLTELKSVESLDFVSKVITPSAIEIPATEALSEKYESVLVTVVGRATDAYTGTGDWSVNTGSQTVAISNFIYGTYSSLKDYKYQVTGVVYAGKNDAYKVEPREAKDIINLSQRDGIDDLASQVKVYPNPFDKYISLSVSSDVVITKAVITNIAGQLVKEVINPSNSISTTELRSGVYFISLHTVDGIAKTERIIKR